MKQAFTVVEFLVVGVVASILGAIPSPAFAQAKTMATISRPTPLVGARSDASFRLAGSTPFSSWSGLLRIRVGDEWSFESPRRARIEP